MAQTESDLGNGRPRGPGSGVRARLGTRLTVAWRCGWWPVLACAIATAALAAEPPGPAVAPPPLPVLRVLVRDIEPFSFEKNSRRTGFAMELWAEIAKEAGFQYVVQPSGSARAMVDSLAAREADVGIGALSITEQREQIIDFSYPFYHSGLDIVTTAKGSSVFKLIRVLFNMELLKTIGLLVLLVLAVSHVLWWLERHINHEDFPTAYQAGLGESIWWTVCVMITLACDRKAPKGLAGRLVGTVWMVGGVLLVSLMTASFSSSLTVSRLAGEITGPADLPGHTVATVSGSTAEKWLSEHQIPVRGYPSAAEAVAAVSKEEASAAVYDEPILRYQLTKSPDKTLHLVGNLFEKQDYGFGLQLNSPYHKKIDQVLLKLIESQTLEELNNKWFGEPPGERKDSR